MGDRTAFFYGTLMVPKVLYRVCYNDENADKDPVKKLLASKLSIRPAILRDFCRHRVRDVDYPGIVPDKGHSVQGTYVTGLTDADIAHLDMFEGDEYTRKAVKVEVADGICDAETYVWTSGDHYLEETEWDFEEFCQEKLHRWVGNSDEFREVDELIATEGGDPTGGRDPRRDSRPVEEVLNEAV